MACRISDFIRPEWIIPSLKATTKEEALKEIANHLAQANTGIDPAELSQKLLEREQKASTGADQGLAIPHATIQSASRLLVSFARSNEGIDFGALDSEVSNLFFTIVTPLKPREGETSYLQAISSICKLMRSAKLRARLLAAQDAQEIFEILTAEEAEKENKGATSV